MRRHLLLLALVSLLVIPAQVQAGSADKLIVHEWGTFTSFAGSDGVYIDYRTRIGGDLPDFVLDRARASSAATRPTQINPNWLLKGKIPTLSRMETPVTYFYTDTPMSVHASVDFPAGLLTEFYPPIRRMSPVVSAAEKSGKGLPAVGGGMLDWGQLTLIPQMTPMEIDLPIVSQQDRYAAARDTDSDYVEVTDSHGTAYYSEKFLFYRGICNIELPLDLKCLGHDQFQLTDPGKTPISAAFLIQIDGGKVRFQRYDKINGPRMLSLPNDQSSLEILADAMTHDLAASGLYEKEAKAMVATWRTSWFGEEGTRLLYILPATMADANLPLTITPKPQQIVRVMVGRLEVMTPEREHDLAKRLAGEGPINDLGRFAEPSLRRIVEISNDPRVKSRAQALLAKMRG